MRVLNGRRGFTLLELLIALTILSVIVVLLFGALRTGLRAWEKGERDLDSRQRQRIVLDLVKRQLASTCAREAWGEGQKMVPLKGNSKSIEFISQVPLAAERQIGLVAVTYVVEGDTGGEGERLLFFERDVAAPQKKRDAGRPEEEVFTELLGGLKSIGFEYLKVQPGAEASLWQKTWDPALDKGVPRAVRVTLTAGDETEPLYLIASAGE